MKRLIVLCLTFIVVVAISATTAFSVGQLTTGQPSWYHDLEKTTDKIANQLLNAVPYPTAQMRDSLERRNLSKRLTRFNKPQKVGYLYLMSFGKFVGYYVVKGKISSVNSQLTNTQQTWDCGDPCTAVVESMGDDGTFGPNEGGDNGIFFFTATDVLVETTLDWVYSDTPLKINVPNLLK